MKRLLLIAIVILILGITIACVTVFPKLAYDAGKDAAIVDLDYQNHEFLQNNGYQPASEFKDGVAYLNEEYPAPHMMPLEFLGVPFRSHWRKGYTDYCSTIDLKVVITDKKAPLLGHPDFVQDWKELLPMLLE